MDASPQIGWGHQSLASEWSQLLIGQKCLCGEAIIVQWQRQNIGPNDRFVFTHSLKTSSFIDVSLWGNKYNHSARPIKRFYR